MSDNLILRIGEKPTKYLVQGLVGLIFVNETLDSARKVAEFINEYEPQIRDTIGSIGYWIGQIGLPLVQAIGTAAIGYIATKGTGLIMEKYWYKPSTKNSE